ncbi:MAG: AzlC family ABC transporter permease [Clostridia bacterium]|nr:AzlC family ABC transporter permease [Clostridia bacterium]
MKRNPKAKITKNDLKRAFIKTIPVLTGYLVLGIGYGIIMQVKGFGILWALGLSLFLFAGSMQFVAIGLLTGGASLLTTALTTLAVNARHLFYGISMVDKYKKARRKPFLIFALTDETYALVSNSVDTDKMEEGERDNYFFLVSFFDWIYWSAGTAIGCLAGSVLHFNTAGIDFALTALFVSIFVEQWIETRDHTAAVTGVLASVLMLLIFGADNFLIPAMILIAVALTVMRKKKGITNEGGGESE